MSKIEWCDETWNPIIGCSKISAGCKNCYAEKMAARLAMIEKTQERYLPTIDSRGKGDSHWTGKTVLVGSALNKPFHWRKPRTIFVCSMGDLFHESVPDQWIVNVLRVMNPALAQICGKTVHKYMILTKRPTRMLEFLQRTEEAWPLPNVALGVTAENQEMADRRIPILLQCPAAKRFVSVEPMLSSVILTPWLIGLDLVICGGETGPGSRGMIGDWPSLLERDCRNANVPFMFKKWGDGIHRYAGQHGYNHSAKHGGRMLNGITHDGVIDWAAQ